MVSRRAEELKILEEQGVPIQISERFIQPGDTVVSLGDRLRALALARDERLTRLEQDWVLDALPGRDSGPAATPVLV